MCDINNPLDKFGEFIVENMRDKGINHYDDLVQDLLKADYLKLLQEGLKQFDENQLYIIRKCVVSSIDNAMHDFLFALQENSDLNNDIQILVNGENIIDLSDGLSGELYTEDGWYAKYSKYRDSDKE